MLLIIWLLVGLDIGGVAVYGQSHSVTWNGNTVNDPVLIFWDELPLEDHRSTSIGNINSQGALVCKSDQRASPAWLYANLFYVTETPRSIPTSFIQIISSGQEPPLFSRMFRGRPVNEIAAAKSSELNAVFRCRVSGSDLSVVTLVNRGSGIGAIQSMSLSLGPRSGSPGTFTLYGDTTRGPPSSNSWMRNGAPIRSGDSYIISVALIDNSVDTHLSIKYRNTLIVRGDLSGVYTYVATNRISREFTEHITISRRPAPSNVVAQQTGRQEVRISWEDSRPDFGYRVTIGDDINTLQQSSLTQSIQAGTHTVEVVALFYPVSSEPARLTIVVRDTGSLPPIVTALSATATSARVTWRLAIDSFTPESYKIVVARVTGSGQTLCPDVKDRRSIQAVMNTFTMEFSNLHEFSSYEVNVTANFTNFGMVSMSEPGISRFTTESAAPVGAPSGVTARTASRNVSVSWNAIECLERNGVITNYVVEFEERSGATVRGDVMNQTFIASELTPHTEYTFRVAGTNRDGQGPFSDTITFTTAEDAPGAVSNLMATERDESLVVTWSPPLVTNGVIIAYEVAHWTSFSPTAVNTTKLSIPLALTDIFNISVRAYTRAGPGPEAVIAFLIQTTYTSASSEVDATAVSSALDQLPVISGVMAFTIVAVVFSGVIIVLMLIYLKRKLRKLRGPKHFINPFYDDFLMDENVEEDDNYLMEGEDTEGTPPKITVFPSDMQYAEEGERVFFRVVATGEPYPALSWYHNDTMLKSDEFFDIQPLGSLCILSAAQEHGGVYRLLAWNSRGSAEKEVRLTVTQRRVNEQKSVKALPVPAIK